MRAVLHEALAELLEYPREGHAARVRALVEVVVHALPEAAADLGPLAAFAAASGLGAAEELYVGTFDANAERALEVGWQVFGEQYARGAFLVRLRERMRDLGLAETTELPDHLTQVLRLLGRMPAEEAAALVAGAVEPSLRRMTSDRSGLGADNPYAGVLAAVARAVGATVPAPEPEPAVAAGAPAPGGER